MKRNVKVLVPILTIAVLLVAGVVTWMVLGRGTVEEAVQSYLGSWEKADYHSMYENLSVDSQKSISEDAFVKRYQSIFEGIEAKNMHLQAISPDKSSTCTGDHCSFQFHLQMNTVAGLVSFDDEGLAVREGRRWKINWSPARIFPKLQDGEKVSVQTTKAERGEILDRRGNGLAVNEEELQIGIVPKDLPASNGQTLQELAPLLQMSTADIDAKRNASWVQPDYFVPLKLLPKGDTRIKSLLALQGVTSMPKKVRVYPYREASAHLIGYIGSMTAEEEQSYKSKGYQSDDLVGKVGLERVYEEKLHGQDGVKISIVDKDGTEKQVIAEQKARDGETMHLTIDADLQTDIYTQMKVEAGAGVAVRPTTGDVLALVSTPSYDPNDFIAGLSDDKWKQLNEDPKHPLQNRFASTFPPGSAFKPLTAAIGLDTHSISTDTVRQIDGLKWQKDPSWGNYFVTRVPSPYSQVDLQKALMTSDNIYFAQTALSIGAKTFVSEANKFGFGEKLPFDYPISSSTLANDGIKNEIQLADSGYGQGEVLMNPLHVAVAYTSFVNDGDVLVPHLLLQDPPTKQVWKAHVMNPDVDQTLSKQMVQVIDNPVGTGHGAHIEGMTLAGKTGTAELKDKQDTIGKEFGWFVAYNTEEPKLLLTLMMENVQERGDSHALAPKVKSIFEHDLH